MPREADTSDSGTPNENQTVNDNAPREPREISSLRNFMERESASSADGSSQSAEGVSGSNTGSDSSSEREPAIPRDRFDQVNQQKNQFQQENQQLRQQMQQMQQMIQMGQMQQQQGGQVHNPGGMVGQAPQQPQQTQQQSTGINWDDPEVQKEWREKLGNNPIKGMREFFQQQLQELGTPMLEQVKQELMSQVQPVRNAYMQQTLGQYAQQRSQQDPSFQQIAPYFQQVVQEAVNQRPNLQLNGQTLSVLEQVARINAQNQAQQFGMNPQVGQGVGFGQQQQGTQQNPPFSERPQGQQPQRNTGQTRSYSAEERQVAKMFGYDNPADYFGGQGSNG